MAGQSQQSFGANSSQHDVTVFRHKPHITTCKHHTSLNCRVQCLLYVTMPPPHKPHCQSQQALRGLHSHASPSTMPQGGHAPAMSVWTFTHAQGQVRGPG